MIRSLRRKFILANMLLVSMVLLVVFGALMASNYRRLEGQSMMAMRAALSWSSERPPDRPEIGPRPEGGRGPFKEEFQAAILPVFSVTMTDGLVTAVNDGGQVAVSDEVAAQAAQAALEHGGHTGAIPSLNLRFLREDRPDGTTGVAFIDRSWERANLLALLRTSLLVGLLGLCCFFVISLFLSAQALRPVRRAWEQQRQFVADASHELKTPLTVILADAGILLSHPEDTVAQQHKWVEYIQAEAQRMKGLVEDLLFLAKSDDGRAAAVPQLTALSDLAWECLLPFESVAFEAGVALEGDVAPGLSLWGNPDQLRRLIIILLDNAVKYAGPSGAATLTLHGTADEVVLAVHNTGETIAPQHLAHLFERFYRTDSGRARTQGGYGLGLAIAKSIVDAHRGKISVTSSAAAGTVFTVRLPCQPPRSPRRTGTGVQ